METQLSGLQLSLRWFKILSLWDGTADLGNFGYPFELGRGMSPCDIRTPNSRRPSLRGHEIQDTVAATFNTKSGFKGCNVALWRFGFVTNVAIGCWVGVGCWLVARCLKIIEFLYFE